MLEANIRIVEFGADLRLQVRRVQASGPDLTVDLLQKACDRLRKRYGLAAVPVPGASEILVATQKPVKQVTLEGEDWYLEAKDIDVTRWLCFRSPLEASIIAQLFERGLLARLERDTPLWVIKKYPRIFYEPKPFSTAQDIAAYRRYEVSCEPIEGVGVGFAIDIGTAFFTNLTVADYFRDDLAEVDQERLQERFEYLTERRGGKKGTLLYNNGKNNTTCYFDSFPRGITSATTGVVRANRQTFPSLVEFYRQAHGVIVQGDESIAKVSFKNIDRPQPVCAKMLRLRIMNESLPRNLKQVDKIAPDERDELVRFFWNRLDFAPLGKGMPKVSTEFWRPSKEKTFRVEPADLLFRDGRILRAPRGTNIEEHREYYRKRLELLHKYGCYDVPPAVKRVLHVAVPHRIEEAVAIRLAEDITECLTKWTCKAISWELVQYKSLEDAFARLRRATNPGLALFIFEDEDPGAYFIVARQLKDWRVKRITTHNLRRKAAKLRVSSSGNGSKTILDQRALRSWESFVEMSALDVLQHMDCVPWILAGALNYPAQLAIDVGERNRHFALSLMICQPGPANPRFWLDTVVFDKTDFKEETINSDILHDAMISICQRPVLKHPNFTPLPSLLVWRDGRECGDELTTILGVEPELVEMGFFGERPRTDVIDVHKNSVKGQRIWERSEENGRAFNALEGNALIINRKTVVMINTGVATLPQGRTAEPVILKGHDDRVDMKKVASDFHVASQFNWSSPSVAQSLALVLKRTDDQLKNRAAQEIKNLQ